LKQVRDKKKMTKYLFRLTIVTFLIAILTLVWVGRAEELYHSAWSIVMEDVKNIVIQDGDNEISSKEEIVIDERISEFNRKYGSLVFLSVFYTPELNGEYNLNEAKYVFQREGSSLPYQRGSAGLEDENWYVEVAFDDEDRKNSYIIPIFFFILSCIVCAGWIVSRKPG